MDAALTPAWWTDARLHVVSGKGGVGKTTVAAALAIALATGGRRTLLVEVEDRQGIAQLFNIPPLPYAERPIAAAPGEGEVYALAVEPEAALVDYLDMFYGLGRAGGMLRRVGAIDFATSVAPGLRDVLLTGKVKEATTRAKGGKRAYDAVVLDAPPTGRIGRFLNVTGEVAALAKVGPIKKQSDGVMDLLRSSRTAIHLVTLLEEMPVQETLEAAHDLRSSGLDIASVVVNMATEPQMSAGELDDIAAGDDPLKQISTGLKTAGLAASYAEPLRAELVDYARRFTVEQQARADLPSLGVPITELPRLHGQMTADALGDLAELIREQTGADEVADV
ncbi:ArsA-related P-loop ATPase [Cumulibacter manganitolerans]|uniref:ArsA-related P-loop ATPase n=1 Tax=Cumulibacter manganitolerans TaxID=1884992 RepID=UPI0012980A5D|nr:ArsA-related P-loop ATPase [Cumulibacter manganitolerans]